MSPALEWVEERYMEDRGVFEGWASSPTQASVKGENLRQGKAMKRYVSRVLEGLGDLEGEGLLERAGRCRDMVHLLRKASV
jgi:hypothetical protein